MFNHPQIPFGSIITGEAIKAFAARGDFTVSSIVVEGAFIDDEHLASITDESLWVVCTDAFGHHSVALFRYLYKDVGVMADERIEICAYTEAPEDDD